MRKENSTFNLHFLSQAGVGFLHNNDYYGCSELDGFACYVVADGLLSGNSKGEDASARLAVEAVISAFNAAPSISRRSVHKLLESAHDAMRNNKGKERRRASVTVVVTNYQKLRYGYAGNCRFHLYRSGKLIQESRDHSMSWNMMEEGQLPKDKIAYHAERNNLEVYCGTLKAFRPTVSRAIKLKNADVFSLFTRGIWENATTNDMLASVQSGENKPDEAARLLERLILDAVQGNKTVENYTVCFVFVDKVFLDPDAKKRKKRIIIITVIVVLVLAIITVAVILYLRWRSRTEQDMNLAFQNGTEYIQGGNFIRAKEEFDTAYELAEKLWDEQQKGNINQYIMLVDAIVYADDLFQAGDYEQAVDAYGAAENQSRFADNASVSYIEGRREKAAGYLDVHEQVYLGDTLANSGDLDRAEETYLAARALASRLYYTEGKAEANDALEALYQLRQGEVDEQKEQAAEKVTAAELIAEGDKALQDGDLVSAELYYQMARDKFEELGDADAVTAIDEKMGLLGVKETQNEYQLAYAADYILAGDEMAGYGEYVDAKRLYLLGREIYANLGDQEKIAEVDAKIELIDLYAAVPVADSTADPTNSASEG